MGYKHWELLKFLSGDFFLSSSNFFLISKGPFFWVPVTLREEVPGGSLWPFLVRLLGLWSPLGSLSVSEATAYTAAAAGVHTHFLPACGSMGIPHFLQKTYSFFSKRKKFTFFLPLRVKIYNTS